MFSIEKFINVIHEQLLRPLLIQSYGFDPSYSTKIEDLRFLFYPPYCKANAGRLAGRCTWWHEEPLNNEDLTKLQYYDIILPPDHQLLDYAAIIANISPESPSQPPCYTLMHECNFHLFANSEISLLKKKFLQEYRANDWYFFYHGFVALDWFHNYKYLNFSHYKINKVFICLNHLLSNNRSYRLNLLSHIKSKKIEQFGYVSAPLLSKDVIKNEILDENSRLSIVAKKHILNHLVHSADPMVLDSIDYKKASADICHDYIHSAMWNVVTETNFYDDKLHLTEKIFKPIVTRRPFILVSAPGNLAYLRSYGFKTFSDYIDESYDDEQDPDKRIEMITRELEKLCQLSHTELMDMFDKMQDILEFNHQHFYGKFKEIIVNELVDNFEGCAKKYNLHLSDWRQVPTHLINFEKVKKLLLS